jgi:hypothetical protein
MFCNKVRHNTPDDHLFLDVSASEKGQDQGFGANRPL